MKVLENMLEGRGSCWVSEGKHRHAAYVFEEMGKFQKGGVLCDITVPGQLQVVPAHRIVLMSARSSEGDRPKTPTSQEDEKFFNLAQTDDVFLVEEAYSSGSEEERGGDANQAKSPSESVEDRLGVLNDLRNQHCYCDVTLVTHDRRCDAHKVVLAACSEYFRAMFTSKMKENAMNTILLKGIDGGFFQRVLDFIYTGEVPIEDCDDAMELLKMAVFFLIQPMINHCTKYLIANLSCQIVCTLYSDAKDLAIKGLVEKCCSYIHDHFIELDDPSIEIGLLGCDDLKACLQSDCLGGVSNSQSELSVLRIVLRWLLSNRDCSEQILDEIFSNVRFALVRSDDIMTSCGQILAERRVAAETTCDYGPVFRKHLLSALQYHQKIQRQPLMQSPTTCLRNPSKSWVSVDGVMAPAPVKLPAGSPRITTLEVIRPSKKSSRPIRDPFHSVVELNGFIYVLGGTRNIDEGYSRSVIRYDPRLDRCDPMAGMLEERGDFVALPFRDCIYVFGGRNRRGALDTAEKYDPNTDTWEYVARMPERLYMAAGTTCRGRIFITGGFNNYETVGTTFSYDPEANTWESIYSPMMAERGYHVIIEGPDGRLWVVGGVDNPFSGRNVWEVEAFDVETRMWNFVGQILPVSMLLSTVRLNVFINKCGRICLSAVSFPEKHSMLEYDEEKRMWFEMKSKPSCFEIEIDAP